MSENTLEEGHLYTVKNGQLEEIPIDPEDSMRKVRITDDAINAVIEVQKKMRKLLKGYKPDLSIVTSALIEKAAEDDAVTEVVRCYVVKTFETLAVN